MSTSTIFARIGTCVLKSHSALVLAGAVVLLAGASCTSATVSGQNNGGQGNGGNGGGGGPNAGSAACIVCTPTGGSTGGGGATQSTFTPSKTCGDGKLDEARTATTASFLPRNSIPTIPLIPDAMPMLGRSQLHLSGAQSALASIKGSVATAC